MMGSYSGAPDTPERTKAVAAVLAVHVALAAIILSGLNVTTIRRAVDRMTTFDVVQPPPPPPVQPPPPARQSERARLDEGAAGKKAKPTEVVAPKATMPPLNPMPAAPVAGTGNQSTAGAALAGTGTGAGGSGSGLGGGGTGDTSRFTPARLVRNIGRGDYSMIVGGRMPVGSADMALSIDPSGLVSACRIIRSSGDSEIDRSLCALLTQRLGFRPALDDRGRPIAYRTNYRANWRLRF